MGHQLAIVGRHHSEGLLDRVAGVLRRRGLPFVQAMFSVHKSFQVLSLEIDAPDRPAVERVVAQLRRYPDILEITVHTSSAGDQVQLIVATISPADQTGFGQLIPRDSACHLATIGDQVILLSKGSPGTTETFIGLARNFGQVTVLGLAYTLSPSAASFRIASAEHPYQGEEVAG